MSIFTSKHVITALLVTPILAVTAYIAVDQMLAEQPHIAKAGQSYALLGNASCRYPSGRCKLVNGDMQIRLELATKKQGVVTIHLDSKLPLQQVLMATAVGEQRPTMAKPLDRLGKSWQVTLKHSDANVPLHLALVGQGTKYFSQISSQFLYPEGISTK